MAEGFLAHQKNRALPSGWEVSSAGLAAPEGQPPSYHSVDVMREVGIDISHQRSCMLTAEQVMNADRIFVMTYGHLDTLLMLFPEASEKCFLVRQFLSDDAVFKQEISDPIGQSEDVYRACRDEIREAIPSIIDHLKKI